MKNECFLRSSVNFNKVASTDRQTDKQTGKQIDRQIDIYTYTMHKYINAYIICKHIYRYYTYFDINILMFPCFVNHR